MLPANFGQVFTHLHNIWLLHSVVFVKTGGFWEVKVRIVGRGSVGCPTDIHVNVSSPKHQTWFSLSIGIEAAVDHRRNIGDEQEAAEHIPALSVLEGAILKVTYVDLSLLLSHLIS